VAGFGCPPRGGLTPEQAAALEHHEKFLDELESTPMTKSYKMLVLQAMLNEDRTPVENLVDALSEAVVVIAQITRGRLRGGGFARPRRRTPSPHEPARSLIPC
jgi:hypothetical protein